MTVTAWIEVGAPEADRLHYGSKLADRTVVYTHRDPAKVLARWAGKRIHRADEITLYSFDTGFVEALADGIDCRNILTLSVTEGVVYAELNGETFTSAVHQHPLG